MANDVSSRQWRLDTPRAFGTAGALIWPGNVYIKQIEFTNYAAQGNQAILKDINGKTVWSATGAADLSPVRLGDIGWVEGLILDTLTGGGLVVVYVK
jgi:hypothetical protein